MGKVEPIHHSILTQQVGELSNVRRDPARLISPTMMDKGRMGTIIIWPAYNMVRS